jgi:dynein heavy chain
MAWIINPKAMEFDDFFGIYRSENNDYEDGCITNIFRQAKDDTSAKLKLITVDGPVEPTWVENFNSVLDDNKKLCFGKGDFISMSPKMKVVIETSDLSHCSPATVSRCSVIFMEENEEMLPLKSQINKWIRSWPNILCD